MSFVPAPQQANVASANKSSNNEVAVKSNTYNAAAVAEEPVGDDELIFKIRTFDVYWVDKYALMYKAGVDKTFDKETRKAYFVTKQRSSIPIILLDMAPPEGSIFDPAKKWEEEKKRQAKASTDQAAEDAREAEAVKAAEKGPKKNPAKKNAVKKNTADTIKESNVADKQKKDHERDLQKLSNLKTLKTLQDATCETTGGKIHRMIKMLHMAVCDMRQGVVGASEAEVMDILWALEEMAAFKVADEEVAKDKVIKKEAKEQDKTDTKKGKTDKDKKDKKDEKKDEKEKKFVLSPEGKALRDLYKDGSDTRGSYKDSLKHARKLLSGKENLISFQLTEMADRLPPLSRYNRTFSLEDWQCAILQAIDDKKSAVVCAPTSSGKTLLSTYTCKNAGGTVLFVLPSDVLVWQVAATYYEFFRGNVTVCTDLITFQEVTGDAQVYIGTPCALERCLSKVRGCAGEEMAKGEREFMILDGGYSQFKYLVLDEVHTLNGPEGDALQRIIKTCDCPVLALSATIGNASQLRDWFVSVRKDHLEASVDIEAPKDTEVVLKEYSARFINLQRYVVVKSEGKDGKSKQKLVTLHPVAAMTPERLKNQPELIGSLSMTPRDLMDLWKRMRAIFPGTVLEEMDDPDKFFSSKVDESKRITLNQTKEYEVRLKARLAALAESHPELYEKLRKAQIPPPLESKEDVSDILYGVVDQLKQSDLLPAVAFQLNTYGAFNMFKTLLGDLENAQITEFPNYRKDLIKVAREKAAMRKVAAGKADRVNAAEAEEEAKSGFVDESLIQEDTTKPHEKYVLAAAGKRLNFNEVEDIIADMKKAGEQVDINHALIRGLRRGIAIYTNEVGFACYRRQVQMLAQKGRLAVVFSDDALAYGVNMPFRSCIFCGDMGEALTPLIAQQMQGRAGRRGLDVQGNIFYLGMDWPYIENLMLGQISHVTGKEPRYPIMNLQYAMAASNDPDDTKHFGHKDAFANAIRKMQRSRMCFPTVTEQQMHWQCNTTLKDFCDGKESDYFELSNKVIQGLGYIHEDMTLALDHNVLSCVWEMYRTMPEAIHMCSVLEQMYIRFCFNKTKSFKESDATQNDFLSVLLHVIDRVPAKEGDESLQEFLRVVSSDDGSRPVNDEAKAMWMETEKCLREQRDLIDKLDIPQDEKDRMHLALPVGKDEDDVGPPLDKGVYEMIILKQKGFREDQDVARRNELKNRIVALGEICRLAHNTLQQPHGKYSDLEVHFRRMFNNIKYSVSDMMNQLTDQEDLTLV